MKITRFTVAIAAALLSIGMALAGEISLTWDHTAPAELVGFNVYRSTVAGGDYVRVNATTIEPSGTVTGAGTFSEVVPPGVYFYVATAVAPGDLESGFSNEVRVEVLPSEPFNLRVVPVGTVALLEWSPVEETDVYLVKKGLWKDRLRTAGFTRAPRTRFVDVRVNPRGASRWYQIEARKGEGLVAESNLAQYPAWFDLERGRKK